MSFKKIETQEEFDEAIKERLGRENKKYEGWTSPEQLQQLKDGYEKDALKKYEGYTSPDDLQKVKDDYDSQIQKLNNENSMLKDSQLRTKVANEYSLPEQIASRLKGANEDELRADAKALSELVSQNNAIVLPLHDSSSTGNSKAAAMKELLSQLKD